MFAALTMLALAFAIDYSAANAKSHPKNKQPALVSKPGSQSRVDDYLAQREWFVSLALF
jgi:hypothetical protein